MFTINVKQIAVAEANMAGANVCAAGGKGWAGGAEVESTLK